MIVAAAVTGYLEGFLQDKKDTLTMVGCVLYAILVGLGVGVDYSFQKANDKRKEYMSKRSEGDPDVEKGRLGLTSLSSQAYAVLSWLSKRPQKEDADTTVAKKHGDPDEKR